MKYLRHLSSFIAPVVMSLILPYLIVSYEHRASDRPWLSSSPPLLAVGMAVTVVGFVLFVMCVRMFILIGNGTIMPWDPTHKLIVVSLYRYVRNPMILSLLIVQLGEAALFASLGMAILAVVFFAINTIYFIASEEPGLEKRFGEEYIQYKQNVPRWIPRRTPWQPD